ncbi:hypothetical protein EVAR_11413_1 [Eumeta japonica]|uniref:Uncharacterized protein n=1 Tax=Eumeta variegata TaxID=151549 RepID=A0A4C1TKK0_EUMVA|nr:hypothetical protein EVAR_11413_1 [Eumeta japonica]
MGLRAFAHVDVELIPSYFTLIDLPVDPDPGPAGNHDHGHGLDSGLVPALDFDDRPVLTFGPSPALDFDSDPSLDFTRCSSFDCYSAIGHNNNMEETGRYY